MFDYTNFDNSTFYDLPIMKTVNMCSQVAATATAPVLHSSHTYNNRVL